MQSAAALIALLSCCGCWAAARMLKTAQTPPAAYGAALLGLTAIGTLVGSLLVLGFSTLGR